MLPLYLGALGLGGVLIVASIVLGGHDSDADHDGDFDADADVDVDVDADVDADFDADADVDAEFDADADVDADADHDFGHGATGLLHSDMAHSAGDAAEQVSTGGRIWLPFLSMRFWTFALATFGLTGTLLTIFQMSQVITAPVSVGMGLGIGTGMAWAFRKLKQHAPTGMIRLRNLGGRDATVLLPVGPGKVGKVRMLIDGAHVDMPARTRDGAMLERRSTVLLVDVVDGIAEVTSIPAGSESYRSTPKES